MSDGADRGSTQAWCNSARAGLLPVGDGGISADAAALDASGRILIFGGFSGTFTLNDTALAFDPAMGTYATIPVLAPNCGALCGAGIPDGRVLAIGGDGGALLGGSTAVNTYSAGAWR